MKGDIFAKYNFTSARKKAKPYGIDA